MFVIFYRWLLQRVYRVPSEWWSIWCLVIRKGYPKVTRNILCVRNPLWFGNPPLEATWCDPQASASQPVSFGAVVFPCAASLFCNVSPCSSILAMAELKEQHASVEESCGRNSCHALKSLQVWCHKQQTSLRVVSTLYRWSLVACQPPEPMKTNEYSWTYLGTP